MSCVKEHSLESAEYVGYSYYFAGAGGASDSNTHSWKVMLKGNKMGKDVGTIRMGDDEAARYTGDKSLAEEDTGSLSKDAVADLLKIIADWPKGISTSVPCGPGCSATEMMIIGDTKLGFDESKRAQMKSWCEKCSLSLW